MSPEQASGKAVDRRADIWSFGVVLYEMLVGERLFDAETGSQILMRVLTAPVELSRLPATTPTVVRELLGRCLDHDVKTRLSDIGEARVAIQRWQANPNGVPDAVAAPASRSPIGWLWACATAMLLLTAVLLGLG